ncbi:MAG: ROK family protein [Gemmiger sp.]
MEKAGINLENVKRNNRSAILKLLNASGPMSRKDIAAALGLTPATVTLISNELLAAGVLEELGELQESPRAGRKKILLGIQYQCRNMLCISIEAGQTFLTVTDLRGTVLAARTTRTASEVPPSEFLKHLADESRILMWEHNIPRTSILGVGVAVPGPVDRKRGLSQSAYRVWKTPVEVGRILGELLQYPVLVANNVKAFAEAGLIYGTGSQFENMLFLKWGPGVGCSLILGGQVYEGVHRKAAEIGHVIVRPGGRLCRCGRRGCLETIASTHAIAEAARAVCTPDKTPELWAFAKGDVTNIKAGNIEQWTQCRDEALWQTLDAIIARLAEVVCGCMTLFAPDRTFVYGTMFELPRFYDIFMETCRRYDPAYDEGVIVRPAVKDKLDYIGPLAVAANELFFSGRIMETASHS